MEEKLKPNLIEWLAIGYVFLIGWGITSFWTFVAFYGLWTLAK